jgi:predicted Zn-dependent protease
MKKLIITITFLLTFINSYSQEYGEIVKDTSYKMRIIGLNRFDSLTLYKTKDLITEYFGFNVTLSDDTFNVENLFFHAENVINLDKFEQTVYNSIPTLYITNYPMIDGNYESQALGATIKKFSTIIIDGSQSWDDLKSGIIHEVGHLYGLHHCENDYCVMSKKSVVNKNIKFCDKCIKTIYE